MRHFFQLSFLFLQCNQRNTKTVQNGAICCGFFLRKCVKFKRKAKSAKLKLGFFPLLASWGSFQAFTCFSGGKRSKKKALMYSSVLVIWSVWLSAPLGSGLVSLLIKEVTLECKTVSDGWKRSRKREFLRHMWDYRKRETVISLGFLSTQTGFSWARVKTVKVVVFGEKLKYFSESVGGFVFPHRELCHWIKKIQKYSSTTNVR